MALTKHSNQLSEHRVKTKDGDILFFLRRSSKARRTVTLTVDQQAQVLISAPIHTAIGKIEEFVLKKSSWINRKVKAHQEHRHIFGQQRYGHAAFFLFMGQKYQLMVQERNVKKPNIIFGQEGWIIELKPGLTQTQQQIEIKELLNAWYRKEAEEFLAGRVFHYAREMNLEVKEVNVRTQKRIWGSCHSRTKKIFLNWQLMLAPMEVIDYVVIHELCHLWVPNHSKRFWAKVVKFKPDYNNQKKWLKANAFDMILP